MNSLLGRIACLQPEDISSIHEAALDLLGNVGVVIHWEEAREILRGKGVKVEEKTAYFTQEVVDRALQSVPRTFRYGARDPRKAITIGGEDLILSPAYGAPMVWDSRSGRRRGTLSDYETFVKLGHQCETVSLNGGILVEPYGVDRRVRHVEMLYRALMYSDKPLLGFPTAQSGSRDLLEMIRIAYGVDKLEEHGCLFGSSVNPQSPLQFDERMLGTIFEFSRQGQAIMVAPAPIAGVSSPLSLLATVTLQHAEMLAGIVLTQLVRPGAPVVYATCASVAYMKTGSFALGSPDTILMSIAAIQMAEYCGVPHRVQGCVTDAKVPDAQAAYESALSLLALVLAGARYASQAQGILESYLTISPEKFVIDNEICSHVLHTLRGIQPVSKELCVDLIKEVGHFGNHLSSEHTLQHFRELWEPVVGDWNPYELWCRKGSQDIIARARERVDRLLASYEQPPIDPAVVRDLDRFMDGVAGRA